MSLWKKTQKTQTTSTCPSAIGWPCSRDKPHCSALHEVVECKTYRQNTYTHSFRQPYPRWQKDTQDSNSRQALFTNTESQRALEGGHILLFVSWVPAFGAVGAVGGWDRVDGGALFAGGMGRMGRVGEAGSRLASVVVELHQAEYQVRGHQLKRIRWIGYDISGEEREQFYI